MASVTAFDVKIAEAAGSSSARERAARDGVALVDDTRTAVETADLVISAVTAEVTQVAAEQLATALQRDAFVLDVNSASPGAKQACAATVARAGGRYVEAAVMNSVPPRGIAVPMLLGGPHAHALQPTLAKLGFEASVASSAYGVASAIKLCRSVFVKGMEALAIESLLAARRYGGEREVLASLAQSFPGFEWERQADWFWRRVVKHGRRRAEEMREAAATVHDVGVAPRMTSATAETHAWIAALAAAGAFADADASDWRSLADSIERAQESH